MKTVQIADRVTAIPWALAGVRVLQTPPEQLGEVFSQALSSAELVLITRPLARRLPAVDLEAAKLAAHPPVQVIDPAFARREKAGIVDMVRRSLGVSL